MRPAAREVCAPMTTLVTRESDQRTALHLAVAVPENLPCVHPGT